MLLKDLWNNSLWNRKPVQFLCDTYMCMYLKGLLFKHWCTCNPKKASYMYMYNVHVLYMYGLSNPNIMLIVWLITLFSYFSGVIIIDGKSYYVEPLRDSDREQHLIYTPDSVKRKKKTRGGLNELSKRVSEVIKFLLLQHYFISNFHLLNLIL